MTADWIAASTSDGIRFEHTANPQPAAPWLTFVHGIALNRTAWRPWAPLLHHYNLLRLDVPGYGESPSVVAPAERSLDGWAQGVTNVLDTVGIARTTLIGESLGGTTTLRIALTSPERVTSAVVCSTGFRGAIIPGLTSWSDIIDERGTEGWSTYMIERRFRSDDEQRVKDEIHAMQSTCDSKVILADAAMLTQVDLSASLGKIRCPVLALQPGSSPFVSREHAFALEQALPNCELSLFGSSRHGLAFAYAAEAATATARFLDRLSRSAN